jgi:hypothetical protein
MIGPTDLLHPSPTPHFKTLQVFLIYCPKRPSFSTIQSHAPNVAVHYFLPVYDAENPTLFLFRSEAKNK